MDRKGAGMSGEILFLCHRIPFPPDRGDKIRSHHILKQLARLAPVHVVCFADDDADMAEEVELATLCRSYRLVRRTKPLVWAGLEALKRGEPISLTAFYDPLLAAYINELVAGGRIGTIYVFSGQMGQYVPDGYMGRVIMDFVDVDSAKFQAYGAQRKGVMGWVHRREARLLQQEEAQLAATSDLSLLVSHKEAELFTHRLPADVVADVRVLGNGIDSEYFDPGLVEREPQMMEQGGPRIVFTGQMDYPPNIAAVERVAQRILPLVRQQCPDATFHVVGRSPTEAVKALDKVDGVHIWGRVADVRPWLKAADMALVPLEIARGVQNKVLEAMSMELPVVLTTAAATGINALAGMHFLVADTDEALAAQLVSLTQNPQQGKRMGEDARRLVVEKQSWQSALSPLVEMLGHVPRLQLVDTMHDAA
jgi:sugar transferase (PEP-CTERM/EpsH1 system associated)